MSAAETLLCDQFRVKPGETVLITADSHTDPAGVDALLSTAAAAGAKPLLCRIPRLPFQGLLADPHIPDSLTAAAASADVWLDMTWPYLAGSSAHDLAMKAGRVRYLLLGDLGARGLERMYATLPLDRLFAVQSLFDDLMAEKSGASCRMTGPAGTDVTFVLGRPGGKKQRHAEAPGSSTVMGSCIYYPEPQSVRGVIALDAIFHEYYAHMQQPIRLHIDGDIRSVEHAPGHAEPTERALRRASHGSYGRVIHFTCGFHPAARFDGRSFIEDIRCTGANAIGLGVPWWEPGGGENHPDGVVARQSLWIDGEAVVRDGVIVGPPRLADAARRLA